MTPDRWIVLVGGLLLIAFIVWFFWLKRVKGVRAAESSSGHQEAMILVKGGYTPDTIVVRHGKPVDFDKSADLPTGETVPIEFVPKQRGEYEFACQMGMLRGRLVVE
jgi:plastocyanin domain-containing protein